MRHLEVAVSARALRMDDALRNALPIEVRELLNQMHIRQQGVTRTADGPTILVVIYRTAEVRGQLFLLCHVSTPSGLLKAIQRHSRVVLNHVSPRSTIPVIPYSSHTSTSGMTIGQRLSAPASFRYRIRPRP